MQWVSEFIKQLQNLYDFSEVNAIIKIYFNDKWNYNISEERLFAVNENAIIENDLKNLLQGKPLQYVIGFTFFHGCKINVDERVLIPRPETEELVLKAMSLYPNDTPIKIIDYCTGSGCIAIALAKYFTKAIVYATDYNSDIITLAKTNTQNNNTEIEFIQHDIFDLLPFENIKFDIIISNPPYIPETEKLNMHKNVLEFEPNKALFVNDSDPIIFYERILEICKTTSSENAVILFETHFNNTRNIVDIAKNKFNLNAVVSKDISGNNRFVTINI